MGFGKRDRSYIGLQLKLTLFPLQWDSPRVFYSVRVELDLERLKYLVDDSTVLLILLRVNLLFTAGQYFLCRFLELHKHLVKPICCRFQFGRVLPASAVKDWLLPCRRLRRMSFACYLRYCACWRVVLDEPLLALLLCGWHQVGVLRDRVFRVACLSLVDCTAIGFKTVDRRLAPSVDEHLLDDQIWVTPKSLHSIQQCSHAKE
jgi:hypothetical protein